MGAMRGPTKTSLPPKMEAHLDEEVLWAWGTASRSDGEDALNSFSDMVQAWLSVGSACLKRYCLSWIGRGVRARMAAQQL